MLLYLKRINSERNNTYIIILDHILIIEHWYDVQYTHITDPPWGNVQIILNKNKIIQVISYSGGPA